MMIDWSIVVTSMLFGALAQIIVRWAFRRWVDRPELVERVRELMIRSDHSSAAREMRTLLDIDGHRLPKHVRDAATVWLSEQRGSER